MSSKKEKQRRKNKAKRHGEDVKTREMRSLKKAAMQFKNAGYQLAETPLQLAFNKMFPDSVQAAVKRKFLESICRNTIL
jgi:hypothetical protein